jgi:excisionase family DNA binding protein
MFGFVAAKPLKAKAGISRRLRQEGVQWMNRNDYGSGRGRPAGVPTITTVGPKSSGIRALPHNGRDWLFGRAQSIAPTVGEAERFEPLLDSSAAAKLLGIHPKTLQKLARIGRVPAHSICGLWRFRASELDDWLTTAISSKCHSRSN